MVNVSTRRASARTALQQSPRPWIDDQRFEPLHLRARDLRAERGEAEVLTALTGIFAGITLGLFDQAVLAKGAQRAIEIGRQNAIAAVALLDIPDQAPAVAFAVGQLEQDVEHEWLEREKAVDAVAVLGHGVKLLSN